MRTLIFFIISLFLISCTDKKDDLSLKPNATMLKILDDFVRENACEGCIYELYINKEDPHNYVTLLYAGKQSLTREENFNNQQEALFTVKTSNGTVFNIYTGAEYYFKKASSKQNKILDTIQYDNTKNAILVVKDSFGKLTINKRTFAYPFMPLPKPEVDVKDIIMTKDSINN
ncbi:MAG TPA: hypothetical protein VF677_06390 [Flavobacterium sp.]|jgi:hypothetical protein